MKNLNKKGFTLIELLAVITIMGILMVVAIPTVSRTIENARRDTFLDTAKQYVNGVKTMWMSGSLECLETYGSGNYVSSSALLAGTYYVRIDSAKISSNSAVGAGTMYPIILESGGMSSWGSKHVKGYVKVVVSMNGDIATQTYSIRLTDGTHGIIDTGIEYNQLKRGNVLVSAPDPEGPWGVGATLTAIITPVANYNNKVGTRYHAGVNYKDTQPKYCKEV